MLDAHQCIVAVRNLARASTRPRCDSACRSVLFTSMPTLSCRSNRGIAPITDTLRRSAANLDHRCFNARRISPVRNGNEGVSGTHSSSGCASPLLRSNPSGWQRRNPQVLTHFSRGYTRSRWERVASYSWFRGTDCIVRRSCNSANATRYSTV